MAFHVGFFGTPQFAAVSLHRLLESGVTIAGVITAPDRPRGRSLQVQPSPVGVLANQAGIPVLAHADVNTEEVLQTLISWRLNVIVVVAFVQILKAPILNLPPLGCINVHPSLLPRYRGAAPMQRALMDGQTKTGVSLCKMVRKLDAGDILLCQPHAIDPEDTLGTLYDRLALLGADLLVEALKELASGKARPVPQEESAATYAPKLKKEEEILRWDRSAGEIRNLVRALNPAPCASATLLRSGKKEEVKIWSVREETQQKEESQDEPAGTVLEVSPQAMRVAAGRGSLWIQEIQSASRSRMTAEQWLQGHPVKVGDRFEN